MDNVDWGNPLVVTGLSAFVLSIIGSITGSVLQIIAAARGKRIEDKVDIAAVNAKDAKTKTEEAQQQLTTIHEKTTETLENTNGNLSKLQEQLERARLREASAQERETMLKSLVSELTTVLAAQGKLVEAPPRPSRASDKKNGGDEKK